MGQATVIGPARKKGITQNNYLCFFNKNAPIFKNNPGMTLSSMRSVYET